MPSYKPIKPYQNFGQIIPDHKYPSSTVVINDNSEYFDEPTSSGAGTGSLHVFVSPKGRDGVVQKIENGLSEFVTEYGMGPIAKYGQSLANAYASAASGGAVLNCLRITAIDATYSSINIVAKYQTSDGSTPIFGVTYPAGVLVVYFAAIPSTSPVTDLKNLSSAYIPDPAPDANGFTELKLMTVAYNGRGSYGRNVSLRLASDDTADKANPFKNYIFQFIATDTSRTFSEQFSAAFGEDCYYENVDYSADTVVNDLESGSTLVGFISYPENFAKIIDEWQQNNQAPVARYTNDLSIVDAGQDYSIGDELSGGGITVTVTNVGMTGEITEFTFTPVDTDTNMAAAAVAFTSVSGTGTGAIFDIFSDENEIMVVDPQAFDVFFGVTKNTKIPYINYTVLAPEDVITTITNSINISELTGVPLQGGSDGSFFDIDGQPNWDSMNSRYIDAFEGKIDPFIASKNKFPTSYILDAGYTDEIKSAMYQLAIKREDCRVVLDVGTSIASKSSLLSWAKNSPIALMANSWIATTEGYSGKIRDPYNKKIAVVTGTYALAMLYPQHYLRFGGKHVPLAGNKYGVIENVFLPNTVYPVFDEDLDADDMDQLVDYRINFARNNIDQTVIRATQTTRQDRLSELSEENNVSIILDIKREVLKILGAYEYNFAEPEDLDRFTRSVEAIAGTYRDTQVRSVSCKFDQNQWEAERSIIHLTVDLVYKGLVKRVIVELNINRDN